MVISTRQSASVGLRWTFVFLAGLFCFCYLFAVIGVLLPSLPSSVPLAVMFAWILIIFGSLGLLDVKRRLFGKRGMIVGMALSGALLATLLDLAIEPVAAHVVFYWKWLEQGPFLYYGVPLNNFVAWFVVAFVLNILVAWMLLGRNAYSVLQCKQEYEQHVQWLGWVERMAMLAPGILFLCSLFMFGLIDLTHCYYWGSVWSLCGIIAIVLLWLFKYIPTPNAA